MNNIQVKYNIKGLKLVSWQQAASKEFLSLKPDDRLVIKAHRQVGKSTLLAQILLYIAINRPKSVSYYISPTNRTNLKAFTDLSDVISSSSLVTKCNSSTLSVEFANKSKIYYLSAESNSLRGNTVKNGGCLFIDEGAFISDDVYSVLFPYVNVEKANIIVVSTPRRKSGMFFDFIQQSLSGNKKYHYIDVNDYDTSMFLSSEQKEDYKNIMSPEKYKNEILGQFSNSDEGVFGPWRQCIKQDVEDKTATYGGIDWSTSGSDDTVLTLMNKQCEMISQIVFKEKDPMDRVASIAKVLNDNTSIKRCVCETNSIGAVYISALKGLLQNNRMISEFNTNNTSKRTVIENLISGFSKKEISVLNDRALAYQLDIFVSSTTMQGKVTYFADPKVSNSHDDRVLSLAFAVEAARECTQTNNYDFLIV